MTRTATTLLALAAVLASLFPGAAAARFTSHGSAVSVDGAAGAPGAPAYAARLACRRSPQADRRIVTVRATMRPIAGGTRLALKLDLYQRPLGGGRWTARTDVPGLGSWTSPSDPSIGKHATDVFTYRQAVARLDVPFAYRFRVSFRWLDAHGAVVRKAAVTTRTCREPDLRPDLTIDSVQPLSLRSGAVRYRVTIGNKGTTDARGVSVGAMLPGDTASRTRRVGRVAPGGVARVTFIGPGCASGAAGPTFTVDPAGTVEESDETNNGFALTCPVP
ncbi:MAG TPA: CARDB domain-containing protein [Conexibacter sp.]|nr:CARDB domain-containing protein [Conexibacter sp.]